METEVYWGPSDTPGRRGMLRWKDRYWGEGARSAFLRRGKLKIQTL